MEAPKPIKYFTPEYNDDDDENDLSDRYSYKIKGHKLSLKLLNDEYIYFTIDKEENTKRFQLKINYEDLTNKIPYFKFLTNINAIFKNLLQLFNSDKFTIENSDKKMKIIIRLMNIFGKEENHELILEEVEINYTKEEINSLKNTIKELELKIENILEDEEEYKKDIGIRINKLIEEKKEMVNLIKDLKNENNLIKKELKTISDKLNIILKNKDFNKNIIKEDKKEDKNIIKENINEIKENKNEIKENENKIKENENKDIGIGLTLGESIEQNIQITPEERKLKYYEYTYDLLIYLKERTNEILIYDKKNRFVKKTLKPENFKCKKFEIFPFKSKFVNLGNSLLLTGGTLNNHKITKCYLISAVETNNDLNNYEITINSYKDLKEKRERHSIIYLPDKNFVFVCSGYLTQSCEYTDITRGSWKKIKSLNKIRINASMAYINERYIYIFCGSDLEGEKSKVDYLNDLEYFDINNFENGWTIINFKNENIYNLSMGAFGVIPVSENEFLICGGYDGKNWKNNTYRINCSDYKNPIIEEISVLNNAIFIHNLFCKIGDAYFNFDFSCKLFKFDYKNLTLGVFNEKEFKEKK